MHQQATIGAFCCNGCHVFQAIMPALVTGLYVDGSSLVYCACRGRQCLTLLLALSQWSLMQQGCQRGEMLLYFLAPHAPLQMHSMCRKRRGLATPSPAWLVH